MKYFFWIAILTVFIACGQTNGKHGSNKYNNEADTIMQQPANTVNDYPVYEKAHPVAKRQMADSFYYNPIDETAPFGNDAGADIYAGFAKWRPEHKGESPLVYLNETLEEWGYEKFDLQEINFKKLEPYLKKSELGSKLMADTDASILAIAFGQLYLEGTIDSNLKDLAQTAIKRELNQELLSLWGDHYKVEREMKLRKMIAGLDF